MHIFLKTLLGNNIRVELGEKNTATTTPAHVLHALAEATGCHQNEFQLHRGGRRFDDVEDFHRNLVDLDFYIAGPTTVVGLTDSAREALQNIRELRVAQDPDAPAP